jgi:hypothetical protein
MSLQSLPWLNSSVKDAEKYIILKPWDIAGRFLSGPMFHANSKTTLNEKIELYFNDFEFSHLMIQENYLRTNPDLGRIQGNPKEVNLKKLELAEKASESISNGDLVDAMIHGYPFPNVLQSNLQFPTTLVINAYTCSFFLRHAFVLYARVRHRAILFHILAWNEF